MKKPVMITDRRITMIETVDLLAAELSDHILVIFRGCCGSFAIYVKGTRIFSSKWH